MEKKQILHIYIEEKSNWASWKWTLNLNVVLVDVVQSVLFIRFDQ